MYAVIFDIDTNNFTENREFSIDQKAYSLLDDFMQQNGFNGKQGNIYFGREDIDAVSCVLTIQKLAKQYPWLSTCITDIRMLRIEENSSLIPALGTFEKDYSSNGISEGEYKISLERIYELMQRDIKPNSKEYDELENLSILVENYENEVYPMGNLEK